MKLKYNRYFKVILLNKLMYIYIYIYIYNIVRVNKKYKFDKCILIIELYKILFDENIVIIICLILKSI